MARRNWLKTLREHRGGECDVGIYKIERWDLCGYIV